MSRTKTVEVFVDVDVELDSFDDSDLIEELEDRGYDVVQKNYWIQKIYEKRKLGQDYSKELDEMIWKMIGRM